MKPKKNLKNFAMRRMMGFALLALLVLVLLVSCEAGEDSEINESEINEKEAEIINTAYVIIETEPGWNVYSPGTYRYGPTIFTYPDNSVDIWVASVGVHPPDWDVIRYWSSLDGGRTFAPEQLAINPTAYSRDYLSTCDPGVIKIGDWYYLGYTSTEFMAGVQNHVYVGRSKSKAGPYEKWNGSGWGGMPQPMIEFDGDPDQWGIGEPSFVDVDGTLYIYYSWLAGYEATMVATADATDENWPATITKLGEAFRREAGEDSADVKYIDAYSRFIQISTAKRFTADSYIIVRQSFDGINFEETQRLTGDIAQYCHNAGISSNPDGHIDINANNLIGYAHGDESAGWGWWGTMLNPIKFSLSDTKSISDGLGVYCQVTAADYSNVPLETAFICAPDARLPIATKDYVPDIWRVTTHDETYNIRGDAGIMYSGYDSRIIEISDGAIDIVGAGTTSLTATFEGKSCTFEVSTGETGVFNWTASGESHPWEDPPGQWDISHLTDGLPYTLYSSLPGSPKTITLSAQEPRTVTGIYLVPRLGDVIYGFPTNFVLEWSDDEISWNSVETLIDTTNLPYPANSYDPNVYIGFASPIYAKYIRLTSYKHGLEDQGGYLQLAEIIIEEP